MKRLAARAIAHPIQALAEAFLIVAIAMLIVLALVPLAIGRLNHPADDPSIGDVVADAAAAGSGCSGYPERRTFVEAQAWWKAPAEAEPGRHVHLGACFPFDEVVDGLLVIDARVLLHGQPAGARLLRVRASNQDATLFDRTADLPELSADTPWTVPITLDLSRLSTGRHEIRISVFVGQPDGSRQFQSTGWQTCVRACSPSYRSGDHVTARGWYTGTEYTNAELRSAIPSGAVSGNWTFEVALVPGSGGTAVTAHSVHIDPDFHGGRDGLVVRRGSGPYRGTITIDTRALSDGAHRLVLRTDSAIAAGRNSGVEVIPFIVANDGGSVTDPAAPTSDPGTSQPTPEPITTVGAAPTTSGGGRTTSFSGAWRYARHPDYIGGSVRYTLQRGAQATYHFSGRTVRWIGPKGPTRGRAAVYLDGRRIAVVDQYSASFIARAVIFRRTLASAGPHVLVIRALGTPGRPNVSIDAVRIGT